ncbi:unnamed protein product [Cuscuta campestris]|uniref:BHLH domain-containing protein n=1 Tax=Cuscuta campestris TaxID=132261 RepID=A0A484MMC8_9ASTE|nr:unnamed protein product [Cuscuta campestris]
MEPVGVGATYFDEEWESISKTLSSSHENDDFMLIQLKGDDYDNDQECRMSAHHHHHDNGVLDILNNGGSRFYSSCSSDDVLINTEDHFQRYVSYESIDDGVMKMNIENNSHSSGGVQTFYYHDDRAAMGQDVGEGNNNSNLQTAIIVDSHPEVKQLKRSFGTAITNKSSSQNPMKKPRVWPRAQKNKTTALHISKKNLENGDEDQEEGNAQNSSCSRSDHQDDLIMNASNSKAKSRATRGSATDPQSLYARRRREKINERLRILQNLVPNGTKVDISTMLEEAVHYVKFLQLQIKLLSSDDLWMYALISYNGMDISHCQEAVQNL